MSWKACTLTTAYTRPSIELVTTGTTPQVAHTWNSAVPVPKEYFETRDESAIAMRNAPFGFDVQRPPCLEQNEQSHARAGISTGSGSHVSVNATFPQWHLPLINMLLSLL